MACLRNVQPARNHGSLTSTYLYIFNPKENMKIPLLFVLFVLLQIQIAQYYNQLGNQLAFFKNLPHRSLGMLYSAWLLQPQRNDYLRHYAIEWYRATAKDERLLEGTTKPVIPLLLVKERLAWPEDKQLYLLSKMLVQDELKQRASRDKLE